MRVFFVINLPLFLFVSIFVFFSHVSVSQQTHCVYLSGKGNDNSLEWDFYCTSGRNSGLWSKINVPSNWELEGFGTYNYGHDADKADEKGIYRTDFDVPIDWKGKAVCVVFEGVMTDAQVKVNGQLAGPVHQGAFYRFKRDISHLLKIGRRNNLEVVVSKMSANTSVNQAERKADFWVFGGIFRPVYLEVKPREHIDYCAIDARHDGAIKADVFLSKPLQDVQAVLRVYDGQNRLVGEVQSDVARKTNRLSLGGVVENIVAWSSEFPNLYRAQISLVRKGEVLHLVDEKIGFRTVEVRPRDGVYVNGQKMRFKGVNRHSFWPSSGRTTSEAISVADVHLIKDMNMNAVRMSHYPPDRHFLQVCDSLGLYVINELCAWQAPPYDTPVGQQLVYEMITRDLNHPSVIMWANGNEGGFNHELDPLFFELDLQNRPVIHPWDTFSNINTTHYIDYNSGIRNMFNGRDIFMPTELLHGLYDGGHGAGLDDYWNLMLNNPLSAGMFLWDLMDQAVVRTDLGNVLDTDKDHGADGILGPYREKEGSFYTIKEIWSPVYVEKKFITPQWDGTFTLENRYHFTNINQCTFNYRLKSFSALSDQGVEIFERAILSPDIRPGEKGKICLSLPNNWQQFDVLFLTAKDPYGRELFTWSYELAAPQRFADRVLKLSGVKTKAKALVLAEDFVLSADGVRATINRNTGLLQRVEVGGGTVPFTNGPRFITDRVVECQSVKLMYEDSVPIIHVDYIFSDNKRKACRFSWRMNGNGILELSYTYQPQDRISMAGMTFDFPEQGVVGATLLANGPYRVYNNRLKGGLLDVWNKNYNNTITGESWDYPEFKGYYARFFGMRLHGATPFEVYCGAEDTFLHLFTPEAQKNYDFRRNYTHPPYPKGSISFMEAIPGVGTKFGAVDNYGPQSLLHRFKANATGFLTTRVYFRFKL